MLKRVIRNYFDYMVILSNPLSLNHRAFFDSNNICSLRAPFSLRFFKSCRYSVFIYCLIQFSNAFSKPSPLKAAILKIRLTSLIKATVMAIKIWVLLVKNLFRNADLTGFTINLGAL